jgi:hypothetical protein
MALGDLILPPGYATCTFKVREAEVGHVCNWTAGVKLNAGTWSQDQGNAFFVAVSGALLPLWPPSVHQIGFHALIGSDGPGAALDVAGDVVGTGTSFISLAPPNVTFLIKKTTAFAGRAYRGRLFLPFVGENFVSNGGVIGSSLITAFNTATAALFAAPDAITDHGVDSWALIHREGKAGSAPQPTVITAFGAQTLVATQRRRLR